MNSWETNKNILKYYLYLGCAAGKFLTFKPTIPTKNRKKNLKQNSKAKNMKNKKILKSDFLPVIIPVIGLNYQLHLGLKWNKVS